MNKFTKLFMLAVLSVVVTPDAIFADYSRSVTRSNTRQSSINYDQGEDNDDNQAPNLSGERSFMQGAGHRANVQRQEIRHMYDQDRLTNEGYDPNEGYNRSQDHSYPAHQQQFKRQEQMMRGDSSYHAAPQSYPLEDNYSPQHQNYRQQGNQGPRGYSSSNEHVKGSYDIGRVNPNDHHPVYEYMLGKDGKWHNTTAQSNQQRPNSNRQQAGYYQELGYNYQQDSDQQRDQGDKASPESYPLSEGYSNDPRYDNRSSERNDSNDQNSPTSYYYQRNAYSPDQEIGDTSSDDAYKNRSTSSKYHQNWNKEEQSSSQSNPSHGSSSTTRRNVQR